MTKVILTNQLIEDYIKTLRKVVPEYPHHFNRNIPFANGQLAGIKLRKVSDEEIFMYQMARDRMIEYARIILQQKHDEVL